MLGFFDPLFRRASFVIKVDYVFGFPTQIGDDESSLQIVAIICKFCSQGAEAEGGDYLGGQGNGDQPQAAVGAHCVI